MVDQGGYKRDDGMVQNSDLLIHPQVSVPAYNKMKSLSIFVELVLWFKTNAADTRRMHFNHTNVDIPIY
jgi:hypothetical protein